MARYISTRLFHAVIIVLILTVLVFVIARLIPGDGVLAAMSGSVDMSNPAVVEHVRAEYGLDDPIHVQFVHWLSKFITGDWGTSIGTGERVRDMFLRRLPVTLELFVFATFWAIGIGIPVGLLSALRRQSKLDLVLMTGTILGMSIPSFWEAIVLIYLLAIALPLFPPSGYVPFSENPMQNVVAMILPSFVLGTHSAGLLARYVRSSVLEVIGQDFIRTARAKGLSERAVIIFHALKPALIPVVTVFGLSWGSMLAGAFFIEIIFAIPGLGRMSVDAIFQKDFPVIQATLIVVSINILLVNLVVDLLYGILDPRVRIQ
ncbi:ABC transporter permease [Bradyrhizobium diazoefficiens]|nr:ABC transporter permease [Bradyrhizobium diazoefficiens]QQO20600.1 ABC transporter permease [Bradyrhizobium diazoefficiens]